MATPTASGNLAMMGKTTCHWTWKLNWVTANPMALWTKHWWQTERCYAEYNKAYLEGPCLAYLHRYLELGGQRFTQR